MIYVYYTKVVKELPIQTYKQLLNKIPKKLQERNLRFMRWQDRHTNLFGKILLIEALLKMGIQHRSLENLYYNQYGRPFIDTNLDFNISHSHDMVVCAIGRNIRLGIDIEKIRFIDFENFQSAFSEDQLNQIKKSNDPKQKFFLYWTIKESVVKADGRGFHAPLKEIQVTNNTATIDNNFWNLEILQINKEYSVCLASDSKPNSIKLINLNF
ncbi:4'-phosphopantetheinyl transferase family protein [Flavivirga jejuensis]|uniref:4'-phosphopantetheinyl transferase superfamily protein n=1 Tax=Flavivirga jejuensis TaxID=870487 RepID=A0ABT8WU54_9FLAO|nr:4'-phosphopantetheinyl transferase superfamily protein [Flavivirga jejuensis]MDO5976695.1 4'-phosphopantetheinyl transferase superfamily protein [Flavivirga jejuensis]